MLRTIREVFIKNLRELRGERTQSSISEAADIPLRSYQRAEYGDIPQADNLAAIARAFGVPETRLFLDPDLVRTEGFPRNLLSALASADEEKLRLIQSILSTTDEEIEAIIGGSDVKQRKLKAP